MFYHAPSNQYVRVGVPFEIDGNLYPANWIQLSTPEEKAELQLQEVVTVGERKDDRYYWVSESLEGATLTITSTPKDLEQVRANAISQVNAVAYSILLPSDWMVTRKVERNVDIPADWAAFRAAVITASTAGRTAYESATSVDEIVAVQISWPVSPDAPVIVAENPVAA
jgi:hypothetical protein